jgi:hypothetical protein
LDIVLSDAPLLETLSISNVTYDKETFEFVGAEWKVTDPPLHRWDEVKEKGGVGYVAPVDLNGVIASLTFNVKEGAADGSYPVSCTITSQESTISNKAGKLEVYSVIPGDLDGNERVNKNDAIYLLMYTFFPEDYPLHTHTHTKGTPVEENRVEATCAKEGSYDEVIYCTECEEELKRTTKTIEKLPHTEGEPVEENRVEATCTKEGSYDEVIYCTEC